MMMMMGTNLVDSVLDATLRNDRTALLLTSAVATVASKSVLGGINSIVRPIFIGRDKTQPDDRKKDAQYRVFLHEWFVIGVQLILGTELLYRSGFQLAKAAAIEPGISKLYAKEFQEFVAKHKEDFPHLVEQSKGFIEKAMAGKRVSMGDLMKAVGLNDIHAKKVLDNTLEKAQINISNTDAFKTVINTHYTDILARTSNRQEMVTLLQEKASLATQVAKSEEAHLLKQAATLLQQGVIEKQVDGVAVKEIVHHPNLASVDALAIKPLMSESDLKNPNQLAERLVAAELLNQQSTVLATLNKELKRPNPIVLPERSLLSLKSSFDANKKVTDFFQFVAILSTTAAISPLLGNKFIDRYYKDVQKVVDPLLATVTGVIKPTASAPLAPIQPATDTDSQSATQPVGKLNVESTAPVHLASAAVLTTGASRDKAPKPVEKHTLQLSPQGLQPSMASLRV